MVVVFVTLLRRKGQTLSVEWKKDRSRWRG